MEVFSFSFVAWRRFEIFGLCCNDFSFPVRGSCFLPDEELHDVVVAWIVAIAEAAAVRARRKPGGTVV